jgi:hypothetical protein
MYNIKVNLLWFDASCPGCGPLFAEFPVGSKPSRGTFEGKVTEHDAGR